MFERIVQSSIMRLNRESMDKLYDLMTMVFKYQVLMVPSPRQVVGVTLNHLDTIEGYVKENLEARILIARCQPMNSGEFEYMNDNINDCSLDSCANE